MIESLKQNRTLRSRALIGLLAIFIASILLNRTVDLDHQAGEAPARLNEPDLFMTHASISQINDQGNLTSKISAERFTHYPLTDVTTLELPSVALYTPTLTGPWTISSAKGRLLGRLFTANNPLSFGHPFEPKKAIRMAAKQPLSLTR